MSILTHKLHRTYKLSGLYKSCGQVQGPDLAFHLGKLLPVMLPLGGGQMPVPLVFEQTVQLQGRCKKSRIQISQILVDIFLQGEAGRLAGPGLFPL